MKRLILIRHAKAGPHELGMRDLQRALDGRGPADADALARWLAEKGYRPDHGLVSNALRTRQTWERLTAILGRIPAGANPDLYSATVEQMLKIVKAAPNVTTLAVVGHNPIIGDTARRFLAEPPAEDPDFRKYPTAAAAVIGFDIEVWRQVDWKTGRLLDFVTPKILAAQTPADDPGLS